jgi:antitoxin (DNA-binding transcriptional repressor) of toxin-antitoxin stability system
MMTTVSLEEAQTRLSELVAQLRPGEEVILTRQDQPIARLIRVPVKPHTPRQPGSAVGKLVIVVEDEEHLKDFQDYMP